MVLESRDAEGDPVEVERVGPGKLVGWSWLFPPYVWHFDPRATRPTKVIFFYGTTLREYCEREPSLGYDLFKRMRVVMIEHLQTPAPNSSAPTAGKTCVPVDLRRACRFAETRDVVSTPISTLTKMLEWILLHNRIGNVPNALRLSRRAAHHPAEFVRFVRQGIICGRGFERPAPAADQAWPQYLKRIISAVPPGK